jgi:hypothetical protein
VSSYALLAIGFLAVPGAPVQSPVAQVDGVKIEKSQFDHWVRVVDSATRKKPKCRIPTPGTHYYESARDQVMAFLISARWVKGEAIGRGIGATFKEVKQQREETKNLAFGSDREYRRFLRSSCQVQEDINFRVKIDILTRRIRHQVVTGKWKPLTICSEGYVVEDCANSPAPAAPGTTPAAARPMLSRYIRLNIGLVAHENVKPRKMGVPGPVPPPRPMPESIPWMVTPPTSPSSLPPTP